MDGPSAIVHDVAAKACFVSLLAALSACGSQSTGDPSTSAAPKTSASATAPTISQSDYCKKVCERATSCGNEDALGMKNLEPEAKAAVERSAPETTRKCIDSCSGEAATQVRLQLADRCNQEKDCGAFAKCLNDLGNELKK